MSLIYYNLTRMKLIMESVQIMEFTIHFLVKFERMRWLRNLYFLICQNNYKSNFHYSTYELVIIIKHMVAIRYQLIMDFFDTVIKSIQAPFFIYTAMFCRKTSAYVTTTIISKISFFNNKLCSFLLFITLTFRKYELFQKRIGIIQ